MHGERARLGTVSDQRIILGLATIVVLGVGAQWIAKRRDFPSLLLLLPAGLLAGNVGNLVDPEALFGDTLFPGVTMLVGLLLFQSGLQLRFDALPTGARSPVIRLNTVAAMLTLAGASAAVWLVFRPGGGLATLVGAILVVSGPTVVGPLLDSVRPREPVGSILEWEGTMLDPIGATLGVIALNLVLATERAGIHPVVQMVARLGLGVSVGLVAGALLVFVMSRFLVTDQMEAAVALLFAVAAFTVAEYFLSEAGLFATVTLGLVVANQKVVPVARISGFGETLEVLIIGSLFIVLGALVEFSELIDRAWGIVAVVVLLVVVVRPVSVAFSLWGTAVPHRGRALIAWVDPRGVVAASTAAAFAGTLAAAGIDADLLLPVVFGVILGTGVIYGLTAGPVAGLLGLRRARPNGVLLVGAEPWLADLARCLGDAGVPVVLAAQRSAATAEASGDTVEVVDPLMTEDDLRSVLTGASIGKAVVVTDDDVRSSFVVAALVELLGRRRVYRVPFEGHNAIEQRMATASTAVAFRTGATVEEIRDAVAGGAVITELDHPEEEDAALVMAVVDPDGTPHVGVGRTDPAGAPPGARIIGLSSAPGPDRASH